MHLDGARLWHVAAETGTSMKELCDPFDSVSLCFSKGLGKRGGHLRRMHRSRYLIGTPVGSCLAGTRDFITRARWFRKLFGGGMRQIGLLAGCAAYALNHNFSQLPRVHSLARKLEVGLRELGVLILSADTCMVWYCFPPLITLSHRAWFRSSLTLLPWASSMTKSRKARQNFQSQLQSGARGLLFIFRRKTKQSTTYWLWSKPSRRGRRPQDSSLLPRKATRLSLGAYTKKSTRDRNLNPNEGTIHFLWDRGAGTSIDS